MAAPLAVLCAGGTGGHLFPAQALASALQQQGWMSALVTDARASSFVDESVWHSVHVVTAATSSRQSLPLRIKASATMAWGICQSLLLLRGLHPVVVVGFGGYPTVPPLLAASFLRLPTLIHEQNAVMGRANRFLSSRAKVIATGFPVVKGLPERQLKRLTYVGNPVRPAVIEAARRAFVAPVPGGPIRLLVFGGSQGARIMGEVVPKAVSLLADTLRERVEVVQQSRQEEAELVRDRYRALGVVADVRTFFDDLPGRMADAHLVIARSGASTVSELAAIGRPSLLVPLAASLDGDQAANAAFLSEAGAACVMPQAEFTPARLAQELTSWLSDGEALSRAAAAAKQAGTADATQGLVHHILTCAP